MTTLIECDAAFRDACDRHPAINKYRFGDPYEREQITRSLPCAILQLVPFRSDLQTTTYKFRFYIFSLISRDESDWLHVVSDCHQTMNDILNTVAAEEDIFLDLTVVNYTPFRQKWDDSVGGVWADVDILVRRNDDACYQPD